jgi:hypothetical protein
MAIAPKQVDQNSAIPIIIGVTGHRDLRASDIPQLKNQVRVILKCLRDNYPATPLLLLSPLAEGGDRLVAQVALETEIRLVVPLPMPQEEYENDFETKESKDEFKQLLSQAWKCFELPLVPGNIGGGIQNSGSERERQYAQAGAYIARHSHILIALWDGEHTELEGGTGQIVDFKLNGIPAPYAGPRKPLDLVDNGPVYRVVTPRAKNPNPQGIPFNLEIRFPEGWTSSESLEKSYGRILEQMNAFNRDAHRLYEKLDPELKRNRESVLGEHELVLLSESARYLLDQYALADTLALYFQRRRRLTLITLFILAIVAVLSFEVYAHLLAHPLVLAVYPLSLMSAVALYLLARRKDFQNKHLDYRALAEGLRVQLFWNLAGLSDEVADHYLRQHRTELEWIRNAIRGWQANAEPGCVLGSRTSEASASLTMVEFVLKRWVEEQRAFFDRATRRDHGKLARRDNLAQCLFGFGLVLAALVVTLHLLLPDFGESSNWRSLIVVMGITPAIAAAIGGYAEKMAFSAQAKRYEWMKALFDRAANQLTNLLKQKDRTSAQQLIFDLGKEALEENGDWVMIHRERTADVYKGA